MAPSLDLFHQLDVAIRQRIPKKFNILTLFSDGIKTVCVVSFDPKLKPKVDNAQEKGEEVALTNCCVQKRSSTNDFEIKGEITGVATCDT